MRLEYKANEKSEEALGNLRLETKNHSKKSSYILNLVALTIKREFYAKEREPLLAFRAALSRANAVLKDFSVKVQMTSTAVTPVGTFKARVQAKKFGRVKISRPKKIQKHKLAKKMKQINQLVKQGKNFNNLQKIFLVGYSGLALILIFTILRPALKSPKADEKQRQNQLASALEKINQAEGALKANRHQEARSSLEAAKIIAGETNNQALALEINKSLDKAKKVKRVASLPFLLLDFEAKRLSQEDSKLYAETAEENFRLINFSKNETTEAKKPPKAWQAEKLLNKTPPAPTFFSSHLYSLEPAENQIYKQRHLQEKNSLSEKINWLKTEQNLTNAQSLAIDGAIYILFYDSTLAKTEIKKYFKGEPQTFSLEKAFTPIKNPLKIFTSENNSFIYLLEKNRLIVFDKTGELKVQYLSPQFLNLKDVLALKGDKMIYLLNNNEILLLEVSE